MLTQIEKDSGNELNNLKKTIAKEIMTTDPVSVKKNYPLKKVVTILNERGFSSLPVVNDKKQIIGIITQTDIIKFMSEKLITVSRIIDSYKEGDLDLKVKEIYTEISKVKEILNYEVKDIMKTFVYSCSLTSPTIEIVREMFNKKIHRLYVVNNEAELAGVITTLDIMKILST